MAPSRETAGVRLSAPETIRALASQSLPARARTHLHPGAVPVWSRAIAKHRKWNAVVMSHWTCRCSGPTSLYILTPLPRVWQECHPSVISTSQSHPPVFSIHNVCQPSQPCRRWIARQPTLPNSLNSRSPCEHTPLTHPASSTIRKHLRAMKDPVARTASPYIDPTIKSPHSKLVASGHYSSLNSKSSKPSSLDDACR